MKFDFVSFLGGLTVAAAGMTLLELMRSRKLLGQSVVQSVAWGPPAGWL